MLLKDLINHTKSVLPLFTDRFTDNIPITSVTKSGDDVTVSAVAHGLLVSDQAIISGVKSSVTIDTIVTTDGIATATCITNHDLTLGFSLTAEITSGESAYNGTFTIEDIPSSLVFTFKVSGTPPDSSGTLETFHNLGFNGVQTVSEVVDVDTFKYVLANDSLTAGSGSNMVLMKDVRISGAASFGRVIDSYTPQEDAKLWGFFVLEPANANNRRNSNSDAINETQFGEDFTVKIIQDVSFYAIINARGETSGRAAFDLAQELVKPIYKTLSALIPTNVFTTTQQTLLMPVSHNLEAYDVAYLAYKYTFQSTTYVSAIGKTDDPNEFMANSGDILPDFGTSGFKLFDSKIINDSIKIVKDDNFEVQN